MRVRVEMTVEVDPEAWELTYGVGKKELREDVRTYVFGCVDNSAAGAECGLRVVMVR